MARSEASPPTTSNISQRQLARELVACLGRDGAIHVCKVNGWDGVLDAIVTEDTRRTLHRET